MDTKFLLAALCFGVVASPGTAAAATTAAAPFELYLPDVAVIVGIASGGIGVDIRTSQAHPAAKVEMRLDATGIASIASVTTETEGCVTEAKIVTCHRTMDVVPDGESVAHISVAGIGPAGTGHITLTGSVNGISLSPFKNTVTVTRPDKLIPLGTNVKAPGQTKVKVKVGIKNIGPGVAALPLPDPIPVPVAAYITFPGDTFAESVTQGTCFPWGPWPEGWGWLHPNEPSYKYACASAALRPGETQWYELTIGINPQRLLVTGEITVPDPTTGQQVSAPIVIDTRTSTLPVTGPRVRDIAIAALALIVPGVLLLFAVSRGSRRRLAVAAENGPR